MLELETTLTLDKAAILSPNLCERFTDGDLQKLGEHCWNGYLLDKASRQKWEKRTEAAMDLAMQVVKDKTFPWPGAANIAFPLVTIAAQQFHARAYSAIIDGKEVVKARVIGEDPLGAKRQRAERIAGHMSWQVLEEDEPWEEQHDRLLIVLPIIGSAFKKSYHSSDKAHNVSELVMSRDLVMNYYAKSVDDCQRKTHLIPLYRNDIHSRIARGTFRDISKESWYTQAPQVRSQTAQDAGRDNRTGSTPPAQPDETTPFMALEQHCALDLDKDGYAEPYIITFEETTHDVLRIVTRFDREADIQKTPDGKVISIRPTEYFTGYVFIPSPDGSVYGVGFGVLLGPLNESVNSLINQLLDAGTWSVTAGGFLGRGAKVRGGVYTFSPLEWKRVDSSGDDLRKNIVPHQPRDPSPVLFNLLSLLVNYVNRVAGTTDPMVGENPGQNTPAETTRTMVQEGSKIYSAIFKRVWRCMKREFKKLYVLNGIYMPARVAFGDKGQYARREDYLGSPEEVCPAADPNISSEQERIQLAVALKQSAASTPGYNMDAVERRWLKALKVDGIDEVFPGVQKTGAPKDIKLQIAELKAQGEQARLMFEQQKFIAELQEEQRFNTAQIAKLGAEIENMQATTQGDHADRQIALINAVLGALKLRNETLTKHIDVQIKRLDLEKAHVEAANPDGGAVGGLAPASGNGGPSMGFGASAAGAQG